MPRTVGLDEVGRGSWAGPVVAGAVVLNGFIPGLKDSKQLSKSQRAILSELIFKHGCVGLGWATAQEIDKFGLGFAVRSAMERALSALNTSFERIVIDGNINFLDHDIRSEAIIKADQTVPEVSAASIVAKVARDNFMIEQSDIFPEYHFDQHVGYGTSLHRTKLLEFGPCNLHRLTFKPVYAETPTFLLAP